MKFTVSVFGLGYVGSVSSACLASLGYQVIGVDINPDKVNTINNGQSPIVEPGLASLIEAGVRSSKLRATRDTAEAVAKGDIFFICVGTPSGLNGALNLEYIENVCSEIGQHLRNETQYKVIVVRSTILPRLIKDHLIPIISQASGKLPGQDFGVVANPEFLREGCAIDDFMNPPFTLIGEMYERDGDILEELYASIQAPIYRTDPDVAFMVKYSSNIFHGLKVAFANEIGKISKEVGIDGTEVMNIFCQDNRLNISPRYLRPGFAFGGSCLPKDLRAIQYLARHSDLQAPVIESILPSNRNHIQSTAQFIINRGIKELGVIGLTFKQDTDDLRESPMVELVETLSGKGVRVKIFDENVNLSNLVGANKAYIERVLPHIYDLLCGSIEEVLENSEAVVVSHNFSSVNHKLAQLLRQDQLLIDLVKLNTNLEELQANYYGICW